MAFPAGQRQRASPRAILRKRKEQPGLMSWNNAGSNGGPWGPPPGAPKDGPRQRGGPGGGGRGPWGNGGGPGGPGPDLDELIARMQAFLRSLLPPGFGGRRGGGGAGRGARRGLALVVAGIAALWLVSGFYRVQPDEQGVVLRFGAFNRTALPGLNYHIPWPVETVLRPKVTRVNRVEIGYRSGTDARAEEGRNVPMRDVPAESLMLTGDENIVDINFAVFWHIRDAAAYLFNTRNPAYTVKSAAESVMREEIGRTPIQFALTEGRAKIETDVMKGVQYILDQYGTGVEITQVQLQKVDPPTAVIDSFRDVQRANTDAERMRNEAEAYRNDIVPRARGDAARIVAEADAQRQAAIAEASGQAQRFLSVLKAYDAAKDVTLRRLYIETMQDILSRTPSIVVDQKLQGVVPYLPLTEIAPRPALPAAGTTAGASR
jgi:membrane protease subunit HflK